MIKKTALIFAAVLTLSSCSALNDVLLHGEAVSVADLLGMSENVTEAPEEAFVGKIQGEELEDEPEEQPSLPDNGENDIRAILDGTKTVVDADSGNEVSIFGLSLVNDSYGGELSRYAIADLDDNGILELVAEHSYSGDTAVIHRYEDRWYAHYEPYRGILGLTTEGYAGWTSSAFNSGIRRLSFVGENIFWLDILELDTWDEANPLYYVNGQSTSCEQYEAVEEQLDMGKELVWIEF